MPYKSILNHPQKHAAHWGRLYGSARTLAIAEQVQASGKLTLLVTVRSVLAASGHRIGATKNAVQTTDRERGCVDIAGINPHAKAMSTLVHRPAGIDSG